MKYDISRQAADGVEEKNGGELLEMFSAQGQALGRSVRRSEAHRTGVLHGASHIFIYRRREGGTQVLLQRRSACKDSWPGCLDTSSAGHVDAGESFESTAVREVAEELGLTVRADELDGGIPYELHTRSVFHGAGFINNEIVRVYFLQKDPAPSEFHLQTEEVSQVLWLDPEEISRRIDSGDPEICIDKNEFEIVRAYLAEFQPVYGNTLS